MELFKWFKFSLVHKKHLQNLVQSAHPFTKSSLASVTWYQVIIISSSQARLENLYREQVGLQKNLCSYFKCKLETHPKSH